MADKRIKDLAATATSPAGDDFLILDGETSNTRKISADYFALADDFPAPTPTFVNDPGTGIEFIVGDIPANWKDGGTITELYLGNSVTSIGDYAFRFCVSLADGLVIPNSVTTIGDNAFYGQYTNTNNITIGNRVTSIGSYAFAYSPFTGNLFIPDNAVSIGSYAFGSCTGFSSNLVIPNSGTTIGAGAFISCSGLTAAYLNLPIGSIGNSAFSVSGITNVYIGPNATGYTLGAGQNVGGATVTVSEWTNYPDVP